MTYADANWGDVLFAVPILRRWWDGLPWTLGTGIPDPTPLDASFDLMILYERGPTMPIYGGARGIDILMGRGLQTYDRRRTLGNRALCLTCARAAARCQPLTHPVVLVSPPEADDLLRLLATVPRQTWTFPLPYRVFWMRYWLDHGLLARNITSGEYTPLWLHNYCKDSKNA